VKKGDVSRPQDDHEHHRIDAVAAGPGRLRVCQDRSGPEGKSETKEIELTFLVDPGNRAYVRNLTFSGTDRHQRRRAAP
jgi:hypothetical protein